MKVADLLALLAGAPADARVLVMDHQGVADIAAVVTTDGEVLLSLAVPDGGTR